MSLEYLSIHNNILFKLLAFKEILHGLLLSEYCARHLVFDSDSSAQFRDILGRIPWVVIPETREIEDGFLRIIFSKFENSTSL